MNDELIWRSELPNGLKILLLPNRLPVAHVTLYLNVGSRDEAPSENGIAHFIEHTLFKGTTHRKSFHVLNRLESVGGDLNAYTSKEETCLYAAVMQPYIGRAVELFADVIFNSVFPENELEKEKQVITDEIDSYRDNPSEQIMDDFEEHLYSGHPIGRNILGTKSTVRKFNRKDVITFIQRHYHPSRMLLAVSGNLSLAKVELLAQRYFTDAPFPAAEFSRPAFSNYIPFEKVIKKSHYQNHCVIGNLAYDMKHPRRTPLALLNNYLGGSAMTSRLNLVVREKHGYTYNIESGYQAYTDTGLFWVYFGTENGLHQKTLEVIEHELSRLRERPLGPLQLLQAKRQFQGQIAIAAESNANRLMAYGKQWLHAGFIESLVNTLDLIENVKQDDMIEAALEITNPMAMSTLIFEARQRGKPTK
ncbi:MAG TPA: peptidase M16 [Bacteroidales bacterium]|nr:MAG: hypothetical protein A2X11_16060 [Bacteroidetes bacterium GWE2_42_24]OFY29215.1 MAG: hypothetical protein A2X09_05780 [Bacteroidetes bacterium GWF2_43_11]HAQ65501.1 peptidase M16 [Bacteroidales bacterium]HBZ66803.1 peptidase M16 [Bacteroidales bacterium]